MTEEVSLLLSASVCLIALLVVLARCRRSKDSLGFPIAYLLLLCLIHVPGALAMPYHRVGFSGSEFALEYTARGLFIAAAGCVAFVFGCLLAEWKVRNERPPALAREQFKLRQFARFCVVSGWAALFLLAPLRDLPSIGAAINFGSALWMLGVMLGLFYAIKSRSLGRATLWTAALFVYPLFVLVFGGFLSFGTVAIVLVLCGLVVRLLSFRKLVLFMVVSAAFGVNLFVNYFVVRDSLREVFWSDAGFYQRLDAIGDVKDDLRWFTTDDPRHLEALIVRLNQNEFIGLAAHRVDAGQTKLLSGRSVTDSLLAVVPRAVWPDKPAFGGSGDMVIESTGLDLNTDTSWGVGSVMEFYLNAKLPGVIIGFILFGFSLRWLDLRAYRALVSTEPQHTFVYFLTAAAITNPGFSLSELVGGAVAAIVAGVAWRFVWEQYFRPRSLSLTV